MGGSLFNEIVSTPTLLLDFLGILRKNRERLYKAGEGCLNR
jgi:hypothetical protein